MKEKLLTIIACLLFIAGAVIFCYPYGMEWYYDYKTEHVLSGYKEEMESLKIKMNSQSTSVVEEQLQGDEEKDLLGTSKKLNDLYEEMVQYNKDIYENFQQELEDPFFYELVSFDLTQYGLSNNLIGYLTIPAMELEIPLYLGATTENLAKGAAHLGQTSMPVGGENTNVVLAAHRGYRGIPMFREIEKLQKGDFVTLTTPFDTLTYQVIGTEIILPEDIDKIRIREGEDRLTLFTCHPYRENTHRYVVYCERMINSPEEPEENSEKPIEHIVENPVSDDLENYEEEALTERSSKNQILLDKYVPIVGIILLAILLIKCFIEIRKKR